MIHIDAPLMLHCKTRPQSLSQDATPKPPDPKASDPKASTPKPPDVASLLGVQASWLLMGSWQKAALSAESSPVDSNQLTPGEQLILRMFRRMDEERKTIFSDIAGVIAKK